MNITHKVALSQNEETGEVIYGEITTSTEAPNDQQPDESIKTILDKVLVNEKIRENAVTNAKYILGKLNNWFTIDQLIKKSNFDDKRVAQDILDLLCLFSLAYRDVKEGNLTKYKITLSKEDRRKLILEEMKETEEKLYYLKRQLQDL